jgi:hypothetical protein
VRNDPFGHSSCAPWLAAAAVVMIGGAFVLRWIAKGVLF